MEKAKVFFCKDITPENVVKIYERLGKKLPGKVAVKVHSGEEGNQNYDPYMEELLNSFNEYSQNGIVSIANRSVAYIGKVTKY